MEIVEVDNVFFKAALGAALMGALQLKSVQSVLTPQLMGAQTSY